MQKCLRKNEGWERNMYSLKEAAKAITDIVGGRKIANADQEKKHLKSIPSVGGIKLHQLIQKLWHQSQRQG